MTERDLIAEGRRLLAAATNGPWGVDDHSHFERGCRCGSCWDAPTVWQTTNMLYCEDIPVPDGRDQERCDQAGYVYNDVELIVWARNNLPSVLDALEAQRALIAELELNVVTLDRVADELGCTRVQLDLWFARGVVAARNHLRGTVSDLGRQRNEAEAEADKLRTRVAELETERDEARAELQHLHNDTQQAFTAIAAKQRRDAEHIAELENRS